LTYNNIDPSLRSREVVGGGYMTLSGERSFGAGMCCTKIYIIFV
jgi:hypothetical protein